MVLDQACYHLTARLPGCGAADPARAVDARILQDRILGPLLGIADGEGGDRLAYVSGTLGREGINRLRRDGWALAFYCYPASVESIMAVSDAGGIMPPKSTCFEPKVRSGVFLRLNEIG